MCTHFWFTGVAEEEAVFEPEPEYKGKVSVKSFLLETPPVPFQPLTSCLDGEITVGSCVAR